MAHHNLDFDRMQVLAAIGLGHVLSGRTQSSATISEEYIFAAEYYSPGVSSKDLARPYAEEAGMVIKFRDKLENMSSAMLTIPFPGEEMPSVSAGACQIDARQDQQCHCSSPWRLVIDLHVPDFAANLWTRPVVSFTLVRGTSSFWVVSSSPRT